MKNSVLVMILLAVLTLTQFGCGRFTGGAAVGAVGTGAAYEIQHKRQMDRLDQELEEGKISQEEYEIRKDQIKRGSIIYR
jgi:hypothetical protein